METKLGALMRTLSDFRALHRDWCKEILRQSPCLPPTPYFDFPVEMTDEEFSVLHSTYAYQLSNKMPGTLRHIFGHPIKVVPEPAETIEVPSHA